MFIHFHDCWSHVAWQLFVRLCATFFTYCFRDIVVTEGLITVCDGASLVLTDIVKLLLHLILTQESVRPLQLFIDPIVHVVMANELQLVVTETLEKVF